MRDTSVPHEWLAATIANSQNAVIIIDQDRIIRYANTAAAAMGDVADPTQLLGVCYDDVLAQSNILDEHGARPSSKEYPSTIALTERRPAEKVFEQIYRGKHRWVLVRSVPLPTLTEKPPHAIVYFTDISERKLHEDKLRFLIESNNILFTTTNFHERLRKKAELTVPLLADWCTVSIVEDNGDFSRIAIVHRDPNKVALVDQLARRSFIELGIASGVAKVIHTGIPEFYQDVSSEPPQKNASPERLELVRQLQVSSSMIVPIISRGRILGALSLAYAESGRKYTQEDLSFMQEYCHHIGILVDNARLNDEIQRRDKAKDAFLAALSHELRNPLAPIKSSLELIKLTNTNAALGGELEIIERQFDHLTKLLNDLLDVTRYSRGKIELEPARIELRELVEQTLAAHRRYIEDKQIRLVVSVPSAPLFVMADPTRLQQAVMNILHNAEKFTESGGTIWVAVEACGTQVQVVVRDDGLGIEQSELSRLFDLHKQGERKIHHPAAGLGIGLILVKEIVTLHGGSISAHSEGPGRGAEFRIELPLTA